MLKRNMFVVAVALLVFVPAAGATVYSDAVLAQGPLAYWRFEDLASNNGDVALSEVNNGIYQGTYLGNDVRRERG